MCLFHPSDSFKFNLNNSQKRYSIKFNQIMSKIFKWYSGLHNFSEKLEIF